ncbi:Retrovirus-related Pol polyprotein from transposon 297 [Vitis vinifera]|uniref:Retrovirus-related Pol polyprotein from transposon 297 n=1 Tax=Vitis vinifera TaxID=29760 RepID=A0A438GLL2_VITVI|nr:Retrovirus-related Pol polyprotein from transposon 297 [Vitis vinifera]
MIMRSLQPRFARHLMGFPQIDFGSLCRPSMALRRVYLEIYGRLFPLRSKEKKPRSGPRPSNVGTIGTTGHRSSYRPPFQSQFSSTPYQMIHHDQYRPILPLGPIEAYLSASATTTGICYTGTLEDRLCSSIHQYRAPLPPRPVRQFTQLEMSLEPSFSEIGLVDLGHPGVTTDLLPTHDTRVIPLPPGGSSGVVYSVGQWLCLERLSIVIAIALGTHVMIGPVSYSILFQAENSVIFNLLLGHPWIHEAGVIPSSLHQKVVSLEDGSTDMVPMSFNQHNSTLVLSMMRAFICLAWDWVATGFRAYTRTEGTVHIPETVEIQDIQQALGRIFDAAPRPHTVFDMFGVFVLETDEDDSIPDAYTDDMDFIGIGLLDVVTSDFASVEGASDSVDPPLSFDTMSGFVTRFDDISDGNNDMSIFEYLNVSQHFPLIAPPAPTTHIYDVDDVGDTDDPLGGQSECDSDTEDRKVTPISSSTELIDFGAPDQPREIRIGSSLSPDERSRLIDLLRSYLDVFAWSYEDMPGLDPTIVQHHLPILPHARPVKQKLRRLHPRWSLQVKEEIQKQLSVGFLSVVEYPEWLANVVPVPKKDGKVRVCVDFRDLNKASPKDDFPLPHIDMLVDSTAGHPMLSFMDGATYQRAATTLFHDMMHRDVEVYVDDMIVKSRDRADHLAALQSERGIELIQRKSEPYLTCLPRTEKEIRGFLGRLQYISRFIARLTDICEPIFLLRKNQPTVWNDDFSDMALGCMLAQLDDLGKERAIYYLSKRMLEYECKYIMIERLCLAVVWATRRLRHYMTEYSVLLVSRLDPLRYLFDRPVLTGRLMRWLVLLTEFDIHYVTQKSVKGSIVADHLASLPISDDDVDDDFPDEQIGDHIPRSVRLAFSDHHRLTNNIVEYEACITGLETALDLGIRQLEIHGDSNLVIKQTQGIWRTRDEKLKPYHAYLDLLIDRFDVLRYIHLPRAENQFADALATLASLIVIPGDRASADRVMREVHAGVCGPHMGGHMLARKIMRTGYFWLTMETDCCQFVQRCQECQMHGDLIHVPPSELHALASPWPFSVWGIDIIGKISPKSSSGHEYILVAIDYFTKWVEAASYARGVHFKGEVDTLIQEYGIQHHRSSAYRPQTNGAVEAANKNIKRILRKMVETSRDWSESSLSHLLPVEIEMRSLRVALEQHISEAEWAQSRYDQLSLLDEKRLRAADHVQAYQRKMTRAFRKRVKPRKFQRGDLVLKVLRGLISDPRGKFRPSWSGPYVIRDLTREGAAWLTDLDGNQFTEPVNVDQLKKFYA